MTEEREYAIVTYGSPGAEWRVIGIHMETGTYAYLKRGNPSVMQIVADNLTRAEVQQMVALTKLGEDE